MYPLKNDPTRRTGHVNDLVRPDVGLFREHEVRDACVQTDPGVSGAWGYASRGPVLANQSEGQSSLLFITLYFINLTWTA